MMREDVRERECENEWRVPKERRKGKPQIIGDI